MKLRKIVGAVIVACLIVGWFGLDAVADYQWAGLVIKQKQKDGWTPAATLSNFIDPTHPWTIVKQPVTRIWFVKPDKFTHVREDIIVAPILTVDYQDMSETVEDAGLEAFDCRKQKAAFITSGETDPSRFQWRNYELISTAHIAELVCR